MKNQSWLTNFLLIPSSIIVFLILLEITFRLIGFGKVIIQDFQNKLSFNQKSQLKIMCVGESTTYLGGNLSYPSQLEETLNNLNQNKKFTVINKGLPGIGSQHIVKNIESWINEYQPEVVVIMMGINDHNAVIPVDQNSLLKGRWSFLKNLRIYKLFRWLDTSLANKFFHDKNNESAIKIENNDEFQKQLDYVPKTYQQLLVAAIFFEGNKQFDKAESIYERLIENDINYHITDKIYSNLGRCLIEQKKYTKLTKVMRYRLQNPFDAWVAVNLPFVCQNSEGAPIMIDMLNELIHNNPKESHLFDLLSSCYQENGNSLQAQIFIQKAEELRQQSINPITKESYFKIIKILKDRKIKTVVVQYPMRNITPLKQMLESRDNFNELIFVDNQIVFKEVLKNKPYEYYFTDRFGGNFGHCTPEGNKILAENIAEVLLKKLF